ncbi:MAG TPA: DUF559 domain-containing protein [Pseudonocardiaceae bacterium]|nr:DUF559 domain-containing protein [Pseudonocardiaceae bacterium]
MFQYTIGAYFTDFCCPMCKLIVEIDDFESSHHGKELTNAQRTRRLDRQHGPALLG